jgi:hypothetical protein
MRSLHPDLAALKNVNVTIVHYHLGQPQLFSVRET